MADKTFNTLFLCTGNSARSIIAEALLNALAGGRFKGYSAGSHPRGTVHPLALEALESLHVPTDGLRSKSWDEFAQPGGPVMDFIVTVCDAAAGETCPVWPGQPMTVHWGMPDPAAIEGPEDVQRQVFRETAVALKRRLELMLALPLPSVDRMALHREVADIGRQ